MTLEMQNSEGIIFFPLYNYSDFNIVTINKSEIILLSIVVLDIVIYGMSL